MSDLPKVMKYGGYVSVVIFILLLGTGILSQSGFAQVLDGGSVPPVERADGAPADIANEDIRAVPSTDTGVQNARPSDPPAVRVPADTPIQAPTDTPIQAPTDTAKTDTAQAEQAPVYLPVRDDSMTNASIMARKKAEDSRDWFSRIFSFLGVFVFIGIAFVLSEKKKSVKWRMVVIGTSLQLIFAIFILWTSVGKALFLGLNSGVTVLLNFTNAGTQFLFSSFASGKVESALLNTTMSIVPPIIFFSSLMTILYHYGIMQALVRVMASFMMKFMGTSGSESLSAVANIFVGQTEAPLVIKPYVERMTVSELHAVMTGGFATVSGGIMAAYVAMLQPVFPDIAGHLIAASVMSAPAALVISKIMLPETEESETMGKAKLSSEKLDANGIDAAARGAGDGMRLALNVFAMLLAFVAIIAMLNYFIGLPGRIKNASALQSSVGYLVSSQGEVPEGCDSPYGNSDSVMCTRQALISVAEMKKIDIPSEFLAVDRNSERKTIGNIESMAAFMRPQLSNPLSGTAMLNDCRTGRIAACGAVVAVTQSEYWRAELKEFSMWPMLSLQFILGLLFFPVAFLMGVPWSDCLLIGQLIGEKMVLNEFIAYLHLSEVIPQLHYRSIVIGTYALCGFANFGSIAIQIGGIGGIAPNRRSDLAKLGLRAMIAGTIAAFMTATIAGSLI